MRALTFWAAWAAFAAHAAHAAQLSPGDPRTTVNPFAVGREVEPPTRWLTPAPFTKGAAHVCRILRDRGTRRTLGDRRVAPARDRACRRPARGARGVRRGRHGAAPGPGGRSICPEVSSPPIGRSCFVTLEPYARQYLSFRLGCALWRSEQSVAPGACAAGAGQRIGVGNGARRPLPPNPLCSSPATGSPVSCFRIGIGAPIDGPRTS